MKNLFLFLTLASLNITNASAQSDYLAQVAFEGADAATVRSECKAVEFAVRAKLQEVEKKILRSEKNLINVKAEATQESISSVDGPSYVQNLCQLHFVSFTEALGFEKIKTQPLKKLGNKRNARETCNSSVNFLMESDENIVYAKSSPSYKLFKGGHQCQVIGIRVVQMLTN